MTTPPPLTPITLRCDHCHGVFRITPRHADFGGQRIDCMRCGHALWVPEFQTTRGWHRQSTHDLFRSTPSAPKPSSLAPPTRPPVTPEFVPLKPGSKALLRTQAEAKLPEQDAAELQRLLDQARALAPHPSEEEITRHPPQDELGVNDTIKSSPEASEPLQEVQDAGHVYPPPLDGLQRSQGSQVSPEGGVSLGDSRPSVLRPALPEEGPAQRQGRPGGEHHGQGAEAKEAEKTMRADPGGEARRGRHALWPLTVLGLLCGCVALGGLMLKERGRAAESALAMAKAKDENVIVPKTQVQREAISLAGTILHLAIRQNFEDAGRKRAVALGLVEQGRDEEARLLLAWMWQGEIRDPHVALAYATVLLRTRQWAAARRIALHALAQDQGGPKAQELVALWRSTIAQDPDLHPTVRTIKPDVGVDRIRALGGGKSLSFKVEHQGQPVAALKPAQVEWTLGWQAEVAAWALCQALPCPFEVPRSQPVRISREDFEALYGRFRSPKQTEYMARFGELVWRREQGDDGLERDYLYGVLKDWVPDFVDWPIEYTDLWAGWLDVTAPVWWTKRDPRDALGALKWRQEGRYYDPILKRSQGLRTRDIARGISGLLLFDYLTNNWDRFSNVEAYYGVNNQLVAGGFLSLDNGAAFHVQQMQSVARRFEQTSRFSKSFVTALRLADKPTLSPILFPHPDREDAALRLEHFWRRRTEALARIDRLIKAHGEEQVLFFK